MARPPRIEYEGAFYHITSRGNERRQTYFAKSDYEKFKEYLREAQEKYRYMLHCYVLMNNHYHLLIETPNANLSKIMHYINGSYTNYINIKRKRSGHLFQGRYKAILIDQDSYLLELSRYIHLNPVRAKMVNKPEEYPFSSYRSYIFAERDNLVYRDRIWGMISKKKADGANRYRTFVNRAVGLRSENVLKDVYGGMILGKASFIREILGRFKEEDLQKEEISNRRFLKIQYEEEAIVQAICRYFDITREQVVKSSRENAENRNARNIGIYLIKKYTGMTNRQLGELFGGISYSAVAKAHHRFEACLKKDNKLKKTVSSIMSNVKG